MADGKRGELDVTIVEHDVASMSPTDDAPPTLRTGHAPEPAPVSLRGGDYVIVMRDGAVYRQRGAEVIRIDPWWRVTVSRLE